MVRLEKNTYAFGITKVKGYTFLPGPMISEPYKKKHFVVLPLHYFLQTVKYSSIQKHCPTDKSFKLNYFLAKVRNYTNHLLCFYPEE